MKEEIRQTYSVKRTIAEAPGVVTLVCSLGDSTVPEFCPGQFINIYFPESGTPEGKSYSISSAPHEGTLNITVRGIGEFSNRLCALKPGDAFTASLPYGYFYSESDDSPLVMVAAGIGIAPFRSMIANEVILHPSRSISVFYTARTLSDLVFKSELDKLSAWHPHLKPRYFITREPVSDAVATPRRMHVDDIFMDDHMRDAIGAEFLICGSIPFVRDMWKGLRDRGISEESMLTEAFFSH